MEINTLPTELLEQIFKKITYKRKWAQRVNFRQIALVCKRWSAIIIPMIWKEMEITGSLRIEKSTAFSFYRHIINLTVNRVDISKHSNFMTHHSNQYAWQNF